MMPNMATRATVTMISTLPFVLSTVAIGLVLNALLRICAQIDQAERTDRSGAGPKHAQRGIKAIGPADLEIQTSSSARVNSGHAGRRSRPIGIAQGATAQA